MFGFDDAAGEVYGSGAGGGGGSSASGASFGGGGGAGTGAGTWINTIIGGYLGMEGARKANELNRSNMEWQNQQNLYASNTQVQRRMQDLEAAGINPILAAGSQASSPEASVGHPAQGPAAAGGTSAMAARLIDAEIRNKNSQSAVNEVEADRVASDTVLKGATTENVRALTGQVEVQMQKLRQEIEYLAQLAHTSTFEAKRADAEAKLADATREYRRLEILKGKLGLPHDIAQSEKASSWWGRNVSPYLGDVGSIISSAAGGAGAVAAGRFAARGIGPVKRTTTTYGGK